MSEGFANNTGADKTAHPRSLISAFVIRVLETIISRLASSAISIFWLVSVVQEVGLNLTLSETPKTGFLVTRPICAIKFARRPKFSFMSRFGGVCLSDVWLFEPVAGESNRAVYTFGTYFTNFDISTVFACGVHDASI